MFLHNLHFDDYRFRNKNIFGSVYLAKYLDTSKLFFVLFRVSFLYGTVIVLHSMDIHILNA